MKEIEQCWAFKKKVDICCPQEMLKKGLLLTNSNKVSLDIYLP